MRTARLILLFAITATILGCHSNAADKDVPEALKPVQGNWKVESYEIIGEKQPRKDEFAKTFFAVTGSKLAIWDRGREEMAVGLRLTGTKGEIDFVEADKDGSIEGDIKEETFAYRPTAARGASASKLAEPVKRPRNVCKALYKIEDGKLILAIAGPGLDRPKDFKALTSEKGSKSGIGVAIATLVKATDDEVEKMKVASKPTYQTAMTRKATAK